MNTSRLSLERRRELLKRLRESRRELTPEEAKRWLETDPGLRPARKRSSDGQLD